MSLKNLPAEFAGSEMVVIAAVILGGVNPNASNYYRDFIWGGR